MCYVLFKIIKWILRCFTGSHEIERLCKVYQPGLVEDCLLKSKRLKSIRSNILDPDANVDELIEKIKILKKIKDSESFTIGAKRNLQAIVRLNKTIRIINDACVSYDSKNPEHERLLELLWTLYQPEIKRSGRTSLDWQKLGFQGDDPATDFRGPGLLGLKNLVFFGENFSERARKMLLLSHDTKLWYSFAIAGVNVTGWLTEWVRNRDTRFRHIFYGTQLQASANILKEDLEKSTLILFGHMYSYIFSSFHEFWFRSEPASIMQFETLAVRLFFVFFNLCIRLDFDSDWSCPKIV
eukprot:GHVL01014610.1.p1 GENE.GHVL01014610.1~~GHVL01014610.1.p1  ORF type:complete len:296 (+),score=22.96 GHVL01014610.1:34-921(+)